MKLRTFPNFTFCQMGDGWTSWGGEEDGGCGQLGVGGEAEGGDVEAPHLHRQRHAGHDDEGRAGKGPVTQATNRSCGWVYIKLSHNFSEIHLLIKFP